MLLSVAIFDMIFTAQQKLAKTAKVYRCCDICYVNDLSQSGRIYPFQLSTKTLCMLAMTARGKARFYDTKSLYGLAETVATFDALHMSTGKRGAMISRWVFSAKLPASSGEQQSP